MFENQIPPAPVDMVMPPANDWVAVVTLTLLALFTAWTVRECWRDKSPVMLLILIGGTASFPIETIVDHVGAIWYPQHGAKTVFRAFNVSLSIWVVAAWGLYVGALSALLYRKMAAGITVKQLWTAYFSIWGFSLLLELPGLNLGIYHYYADQPFNILGFPLWWAMTNVTILVLVAAVINGYKDFFAGAKLVLIPVVVTMISAGAEAATSYPMWLALNSGSGPSTKLLCGFVTLGMSLLLVHMVSLKFCKRP